MFLSFPKNNFYVKTGILKSMQSWPDSPKCHRERWKPLLLWLAGDTYRLWKFCITAEISTWIKTKCSVLRKASKVGPMLYVRAERHLEAVGKTWCTPSLLPRSTEKLAGSFVHWRWNHDPIDVNGSHATGWDIARILPSVTVCNPKLEMHWGVSPFYYLEFHVMPLSCSVLSASCQSAFFCGY